jgi:F-type H+-transporting ATPase subunit delta
MKTNKQSKREAKQLFRSCLIEGLLDENRVRQKVRQVLETKPRGFMRTLEHFQRLVKLEVERRTARIESAAPLAPEIQQRLEADLVKRYGPGLSISYSQNPELLGGMRIKVGSDVYDGSIQARLRELQENF